MNEVEQLDLIRILNKTYNAIKRQNVKRLRTLSDHIIDDASVFQDNYTISLAIIIYTLSKIFEKENYQTSSKWDSFYRECLNKVKKLLYYLENSDFNKYSNTLKELLIIIKELDRDVSLYIEEAVKSSKIKGGSSLYSYGISLGRAAELLGISKWELMNYVGNIEFKNFKTISAQQRYNTTKKIFNLK